MDESGILAGKSLPDVPRVPWRILLLTFACIVAVSPVALGQNVTSGANASGPNQDVVNEVRLAPVVIDGETLFSVRGIAAHPAERRAQEIADRIRALAADPKFDAKTLRVEQRPGATSIVAGKQPVMIVLDEDAAVEQAQRVWVAESYRRRIQEAVEAYRHDRKPGFLVLRTLYALGAILALLIGAHFGRQIVVLVRAWLERRYRGQVEGIENRAFQLIKADQIWGLFIGLVNLAWGLGLFAAVYACLHYVLALFPGTRAAANSLLAAVVDPLRTMGLAMVGAIPSLAFLVVFIAIVRYVLKLTRHFFEDVAGGVITLKGFYPEWGLPTYRLVRLFVIALTAVIAYPYVPGSSSEAFKGVSLFRGVIFSLGSSSLTGNVIAGYSMTYRRAFKIGDRVKIGQNTGDVEQMRLLVTHLRTIKNEELIVPNSTILSTEVVNYSSMARDRGLILHTTVGIGYETPWRQVEAMLIEAAERTPGTRRDPPPFILQTRLADFCVNYEINVYCDTPNVMELVYTDLHRNILDVFNEYGVQIMTPAYMSDPQQAKVVPNGQWYAAPAKPPMSSHAAG